MDFTSGDEESLCGRLQKSEVALSWGVWGNIGRRVIWCIMNNLPKLAWVEEWGRRAQVLTQAWLHHCGLQLPFHPEASLRMRGWCSCVLCPELSDGDTETAPWGNLTRLEDGSTVSTAEVESGLREAGASSHCRRWERRIGKGLLEKTLKLRFTVANLRVLI